MIMAQRLTEDCRVKKLPDLWGSIATMMADNILIFNLYIQNESFLLRLTHKSSILLSYFGC